MAEPLTRFLTRTRPLIPTRTRARTLNPPPGPNPEPAAELAIAEAAALARRAEWGRPHHTELEYTRGRPSARLKQLLAEMLKARPSLREG